ncbi:N-6 DNA methylase [Petrotoga mobilis SJ95]|uniref:site-specific DNA-methyltransferase (adenine-specific) n=1 Tax=Petrotoga mobilis (strain DSM 10674 / SJ95) TaxID=403833 RepID=A9BH02_PETMO|nr:class I SAM-dependent DNA methyltransferase [Petrotoga mobilis]ABX32583.1 N-6 DNA methylase [Petrotoga mobilis SJ95]
MAQNNLDTKTLENWLWEAACKIRGPIDAPKYKDYILPLIFLKRLSDVFEDELNELSEKFGSLETAEEFSRIDPGLVRFYLPPEARWSEVAKKTTNVGEYLTDAVRTIARYNPKLQGVIDIVDFNATAGGQRIISDDVLVALIDVLGRHRLGLKDVDPDILGRAYEYLLRKFAEGSGQSAGEFYTPGEVAILMSKILDPKPGNEVYDPCCGSGGLLIKAHLRFKEKYSEDRTKEPLKFYGQEILHSTYAMAKMNIFIHDMEAQIALGDTMNRPAFTTSEGPLKKFDLVTANPMWNQTFSQSVYENDPYNRFVFGYPPSNSADWGWIQHMFASLKNDGKMALVIDTGAVSRGSGNVGKNRERDIRKEFVEKDLVESVLLLPENLFYNTSAPGVIIVINKLKPAQRQDQILLINASKLYEKGRPKNFLPDESVERIAEIYLNWKEEEGISKIISKEEAAKNDYNLSPSRYVAQNGEDETLPLEDAVVQLKEAEEERKEADEKLEIILKEMGLWN